MYGWSNYEPCNEFMSMLNSMYMHGTYSVKFQCLLHWMDNSFCFINKDERHELPETT